MIQEFISILLRIRRVYLMAGLVIVALLTLLWGTVFDAPRAFPVGETITIPEGVSTLEIASIL